MLQNSSNKKIIIICSNCGKKNRIPLDKHIRFKCTNPDCGREHEYKNGKPITPSRFNYFIRYFTILIAVIGSFYTYLFPLPLLVGTTWFVWSFYRLSNKILAKTISSLSLSTAIGLSLLLIIQLILNFTDTSNSLDTPLWLLKLDDFLIWSREHLTHLSEISITFYMLIICSLLYLAIKKPKWKSVSKFTLLEGWVGKITSVLIVITSFTFFAPSTLNNSLDKFYYKHFKIIYREKLKQDRKKLIADALLKQIKNTDTTGAAANLAHHFQDLEITQQSNINNEAKQDIDLVMSLTAEVSAKDAEVYYSQGDWQGSDHYLESKWEQAVVSAKKEQKTNYRVSAPKTFIETNMGELKKATIEANETVEAVKAVFSKVLGGVIPVGDNIVGKYVEELINAASEYVIEMAKVPNVIDNLFSAFRNNGKIDLFARIGKFLQNVKTTKELEAARIAEVERQKKIEVDGPKNLKRLAKVDDWEKVRQKVLYNIDNIDCPFIHKNENFREALTTWKDYLKENGGSFNTTEELEAAFWTQAKDNEALIEAFARGIMWYKSQEISGSSIIKDALDYYRTYSHIPTEIYQKFTKIHGSNHACIPRI
ncbi:MAG: hypothetical protein QM802_07180 [Agriterribacter sp.]